MWPIRSFDRRIPLAPTIIALALITLLVLTNLYGPASDAQGRRDGAVPTPVDIPPQLPAQDQSIDAAPTQTEGRATPASETPAAPSAPASVAPVPQPTVTVTMTVTAPPVTVRTTPGGTDDNRPATPSTTPVAPPTGGGGGGSGGATQGPGNGQATGGATSPPADKRLRVTGIRLNSDRANGARVRCDGLSEVVIAGTVLVDGGAGDVVYQWVFDGIWTWPADYLSFTGSGERQKTLSVPWRVPLQRFGKVGGTLQLRILQPVASAQPKSLDVNFVCA
jgi:hypothetical protein